MLRFFIHQHKAINLIFFLVIGFGIITAFYGRKEKFPDVGFDLITITTTYPGASAEIVEELVTAKIENEIANIEGGEKITSFSSEGLSSIRFEIKSNTSRLDNEISDDIESAIERLDFPADVDNSVIKVINFENTVINIIVGFLHAEGPENVAKMETLKSLAKRFKDDVKRIPGVGRIELVDYPKLQIWVEVDPEKLRHHELELASVIAKIRARNLNVPAGKITIRGKELYIKTTKRYTSLKEIENTIIRANDSGQALFLKDIATVRWAEEELTSSTRSNGKGGIWLNVYKAAQGDAITISQAVTTLLQTYAEENLIPADVEAVTVNDLATGIKFSLNTLTANGTVGLIFVFLCVILFFNFRVTFLTVIGIPFSFCLAVIIMYAVGMTLNVVTMFSLIIVVGSLVDDSILIAESVYAHSEKQKTFYQATLDGTREMLVPIFAVVSTTILAALPIMTLPGTLGDVLSSIPQTVIIVLLCSLLECVVILPGHLAHIKNKTIPPLTQDPSSPILPPPPTWFSQANNVYAKILAFITKYPLAIASTCLVILLTSAFFMIKNIPFTFFPGDAEGIIVNIETATHNDLHTTEKIVDATERALRAAIDAQFVVDIKSTVGIDGTIDKDETPIYQPYLGSVQIFLETNKPKDDQLIVSATETAVKSISGIETYNITIRKEGPPVGKPIDIFIKGRQHATVVAASQHVEKFLTSLPNTSSATSSHKVNKAVLTIIPNEHLAATLNINLDTIASSISHAFAENASTVITSLDNYSSNENEIDLIVKYVSQRNQGVLAAIYNTPVRNAAGLNIPIKNISKVEFNENSTLLAKEDGNFYISVSAFLQDDTSLKYGTPVLFSMISAQVPSWEEQFPGTYYVFKGEQEEEDAQSGALLRALFLAIFGIYFVLTVIFRSYLQPLIIMSIIPLSFVGVILGLYLTHTGLGLMPFLGSIALMGIVVNDSLVMVDKINRLRRHEQLPLQQAVIQGAKSRMRPIIMTSLTTVVGIFPLAYNLVGYDAYLSPLAIALMWGITVSTVLLLILLPVFYILFDNFMCFVYRLFKKKYSIIELHHVQTGQK